MGNHLRTDFGCSHIPMPTSACSKFSQPHSVQSPEPHREDQMLQAVTTRAPDLLCPFYFLHVVRINPHLQGYKTCKGWPTEAVSKHVPTFCYYFYTGPGVLRPGEPNSAGEPSSL